MGGVSGHAGLFSTAGDIAAFAQMMLNGGIYAQHRLLDPRHDTSSSPTRRQIGDSARALGWDVPTPPSSSAGHYFSPESFGHTGFTGTSIWIDPERAAFRGLADQSRESHAYEREDPPSPSGGARCRLSRRWACSTPHRRLDNFLGTKLARIHLRRPERHRRIGIIEMIADWQRD